MDCTPSTERCFCLVTDTMLKFYADANENVMCERTSETLPYLMKIDSVASYKRLFFFSIHRIFRTNVKKIRLPMDSASCWGEILDPPLEMALCVEQYFLYRHQHLLPGLLAITTRFTINIQSTESVGKIESVKMDIKHSESPFKYSTG